MKCPLLRGLSHQVSCFKVYFPKPHHSVCKALISRISVHTWTFFHSSSANAIFDSEKSSRTTQKPIKKHPINMNDPITPISIEAKMYLLDLHKSGCLQPLRLITPSSWLPPGHSALCPWGKPAAGAGKRFLSWKTHRKTASNLIETKKYLRNIYKYKVIRHTDWTWLNYLQHLQ